MKRTILLTLVAGAALALAACAAPTQATEPAPPIAPTVTAVPTEPQPTQPAAIEPSPTVSSGAAPTKVEITLADNTVNSTLSTFKTGVPYTFVIMNKGRHEHNLNVAPPVAVAGGYAEALAQALLAVDETQIPPGGSFTVDFTFPDTAAGADLELSCLIRRHYEDGMWMKITVTS